MKLKMFLYTATLFIISAQQAMAEVYTCQLLETFGGSIYAGKIDEKDIMLEASTSKHESKSIELIGDENIVFYVSISSNKDNWPDSQIHLLAMEKRSQKILTSAVASLPVTTLTALVSNTYAINCFKKAE